MKAKDKRVQIYVHPSFKTVLKTEAAKKGKPMIDYTKDLAFEVNPIDKLIDDMNSKYKKKRFDFV